MIISVLNTKGGCGKSTTSINIAVGLARKNANILLVDTDEIGTSTAWSNRRNDDLQTLNVVSIPNADVLKKEIGSIVSSYDHIVIDGAPRLEELMTVSVAISNLVLIPIIPSPNDLWKLGEMIKSIQQTRTATKELSGRIIKVRFIINNYVSRTRMSQEAIDVIQSFPFPILKTKLGTRMDYRDSLVQGVAAFDSRNKKVREEICSLLSEVKEELAI